jgi:hypothetical protein
MDVRVTTPPESLLIFARAIPWVLHTLPSEPSWGLPWISGPWASHPRLPLILTLLEWEDPVWGCLLGSDLGDTSTDDSSRLEVRPCTRELFLSVFTWKQTINKDWVQLVYLEGDPSKPQGWRVQGRYSYTSPLRYRLRDSRDWKDWCPALQGLTSLEGQRSKSSGKEMQMLAVWSQGDWH